MVGTHSSWVLRVKKSHLNKMFWEAVQIIIFEMELGGKTEGGEVDKWKN